MITLPVEQDDEGCYLTFTDDLLEELGWAVGDELDWDVQTDGTIIVTKVHDEAPSTVLDCRWNVHDDVGQDHAVCDI